MQLDIISPATERILAEISCSTEEDVDAAVSLAEDAQAAWRRTAPEDQASILRRISDNLEREREKLARIECQNVGMPITGARGAIDAVIDAFRYYAAAPERLTGQTIPVSGGVNMTFREPIGVVGVITPWNFPLTIASWKIAPALAAGNGIVIKPSELTPLSTLEFQRIANEAGLPEGLIQVVVGPGSTVGQQLVEHPRVGKIAFTGSTAVGIEIAARAARTVKRVTLELGGKSASIVFGDANLEAAAYGLAGGAYGNSGQDCCARSRVFVERSALDEFMDHLGSMTGGLKVGDPLAEDTEMGPLISAKQRDRVSGFVGEAKVAFRGDAPQGAGFWFPPTVLYPIEDHHPAARQEIFGPVISVFTFEREDEAVERANASVYGLSGSIWTQDGARALRVARKVESGTLAVNSYTSVRTTTPFGGFKRSGIGRELGPDALEGFTEVKNVYYNTEG